MKTTLLIKFAIAFSLGLGACGSEQAMPGEDLVIQAVTSQREQTSISQNSLNPDLDGPTAAHSCDSCEGSYPFKGDGVNIHSCASTSCSKLGEGFRSQRQATICNGDPTKNGFGHIENRNTGVRGWAELRYVTIACD